MKVGACSCSPTQSDYYYQCFGHGRSVVVASANSQSGFLQGERQSTIGRQNVTRITSANLGLKFSRRAVQFQQQQGRFSTINLYSLAGFHSAAAVNKEAANRMLIHWNPSLQSLATGNPSGNERIRNRTAVGRPRLCSSSSSSLPSASRTGWKENQSNAGGRTRRKVNGVRNRPLFLPIVRPCAAVSGGADRVVVQDESNLTTTPPAAEGAEGSIYQPFFNFAVQELSRHPDVSPLLLQEEFRNMTAQDVMANIDNMAFTSSKIRMFRIASIQIGSAIQVLNVAGFARPEYDLPIFCADFFSVPNRNIIVLDLNPLYNLDSDKDYKERYFKELIPLANRYAELLPWGDKLTAESLQFFSPLVLWTKAQKEDLPRFLYPAFQDYLAAWLKMVDSASPATDTVSIARNQEAQHRYISWRITKDPGRPLLTKLYGEQLSERYIKEFLFSGQSSLGTKSFLDYFPQYRSADGSICKQRSMIGKSFEKRPWDKHGSFSPT